ncbi:NADH dehydrogenase [ubiquinone] 1 alpha subcomplex subunit 10, mitochondrial [Neodiprion virginianus]|uniref:NADH dehydrogenase [ubiquinone] 1 alpha subcomplex subunit 10, mitochondrial n=1 Tax=Neodiprion virginianus TaxID=2961670 RepID=UPI001EE7271F|nr:NADH dehydrogenase [ubiquinone] 1 alpha subcomplex subunit 10, mitochondrial [Neodiprion virginianus]
MASALRCGVSKLLARNSISGLCKPSLGASGYIAKIQVAFISGKAMRVVERKRPPPFPYETKRYSRWNQLFDKTVHRMDDNSKIVIVEGPIASGKTEFAEALAKDLDMHYMPAVTMDMHYINSYGFDMRQLDDKLPESCRSYDVKNFCKDPHHMNCANYQLQMYYYRFFQYVDALAHLFSTGEGVVLERCVYSDAIFMESMCNAGYVSKLAQRTYQDLTQLTLRELRLPHLVIYLDVPVPVVKEKIQKRGIPYEVESKVFTEQYLTDIENLYKQQYLKQMSEHAHILIYDWSEGGDPEVVIEDIERLNFDADDRDDLKFRDWQFWDANDWSDTRRIYADEKMSFKVLFNLGEVNAPELIVSGADHLAYQKVWENAPGNKYMKGFNKDMGDTGLLWKGRPTIREYRMPFFS